MDRATDRQSVSHIFSHCCCAIGYKFLYKEINKTNASGAEQKSRKKETAASASALKTTSSFEYILLQKKKKKQ